MSMPINKKDTGHRHFFNNLKNSILNQQHYFIFNGKLPFKLHRHGIELQKDVGIAPLLPYHFLFQKHF